MTESNNNQPSRSIIDQIPSSHIRNRPLSHEELHDIRSLLEIAKSRDDSHSTTNLDEKTAANASNKHSSVSVASSCQPLTGRRVMVPMTSKAFFEGILQPPSKFDPASASDDDGTAFYEGAIGDAASKTDAAMSERIIAYVGAGIFLEMTRAEAFRFYDRQLEQTDSNARATGTAAMDATSSSSKKVSNKKSSVVSNEEDSDGTKECPSRTKKDPIDVSEATIASPKNAISEDKSSEPALPFMEIREECDSRGNVVRSEVINMSNEMKRLDASLKKAAMTSEDTDGEKQLGELLAQTLKESEDSVTTCDDVAGTDYLASENEVVEQISDEFKSKHSTDAQFDEAYKALCLRLEELERLEEEDEKSKLENAMSSKRLQSKGWGKGFLTSNTKRTSNKRYSSAVQQRKYEDRSHNKNSDIKSNFVKGTKEKEKKSEMDKTGIDYGHVTSIPMAKSNSQMTPKKETRVSFSVENEIRQIPRIGQSKVPQRSFPTSMAPNNLDVPDIDPFSAVATAPFEEFIFKEVVKERNSSTHDSLRQHKEVQKATPQNEEGGSRKKLSRFAQQRQQRAS